LRRSNRLGPRGSEVAVVAGGGSRSSFGPTTIMRSSTLYQWLQDCQLDPGHEYYHGWADSRDFIIELEREFASFDFGVDETFTMSTPPPISEIPMPVVSAIGKQQTITFVENWLLAPYFTVSIRREFPGPILEFGILTEIRDDQSWLLRHLPHDLRFASFTRDAREFTAAVQNKHMLYALFHILQAHAT
jgi:hypothetical protein